MIYRSLNELPPDFGPTAITIGNFDGVHVGHALIMARVVCLAGERSLRPAVLTFDPHPAKLVAPARAPKLLTTLAERCELMREMGIEEIVIAPFSHELAKLTPEEFARDVVRDKLRARAVLVGDNFRFGYRAAGDTQMLEELGRKYGFVRETVCAVEVRGALVSSTAIRQAIEDGRVSRACRMLGRPYAVEGRIVSGHGVGSKQTVPTLNLATGAEVLPARGVYITRTHDLNEAREWPSITNIGFRPTFGGDRLTIETYLLAPLAAAGPEEIRLEFLRHVRDEKKFDNPEALRAQILRDVARAQAYFRRLGQLAAY